MSITRRDILRLAGGSILGTFLTPAPWKVLDDSAIWTQNWSLIPRLQHGPITFKYSACTLCPGGCALRARCVNGHPVSLAGTLNHPVSNGILCPIGMAGHHLSYHPLRLSGPRVFTGKGADSLLVHASLDDIITDVSKALNKIKAGRATGAIAVLDQRPGRAISAVYQEFLSRFSNSYYVLPPSSEESTLATVQALSGNSPGPSGFDFENTKVILSFGAPLLDGWGTPGRMAKLVNDRKRSGLRIIQVESNQSRTALQADMWLPVRPEAEAALALGIAHAMLSEGLKPGAFEGYWKVISGFTPEAVSQTTGISAHTIKEIAFELSTKPSIALAGCDAAGGPLGRRAETAIAALNFLSGNVGRPGGILVRQQFPAAPGSTMPAHSLADVPDHSIRVLIIDSAESGYTFPSALLDRKMVTDGRIVVSLSPYLTAHSAQADYLVPGPAHLESLEEAGTPPGASVNSFSLSTPLIPGSPNAVEPIGFLKSLTEAAGFPGPEVTSTESLLRQRSDAIQGSQRGTLFTPADGTASKISDIKSPDDMWAALVNGGCWMDNETPQNLNVKFTLPGAISDLRFADLSHPKERTRGKLMLMPSGWRGATATGVMSPVMSKLFQESDMRSIGERVSVNPETAASHGLANGEFATLQTEKGMMEVFVTTDASIMPGIIHATIGPSPNKSETQDHFNREGVLALCAVQDDGTWRLTEATLTNVKA